MVEDDDWQGGLNALRRDLKEEQESTAEANRKEMERLRGEINSDISAFRREIVSLLEDLSADIHEIKKSQGSGVFSGKQMKKAVKAVKSIGKKGKSDE